MNFCIFVFHLKDPMKSKQPNTGWKRKEKITLFLYSFALLAAETKKLQDVWGTEIECQWFDEI